MRPNTLWTSLLLAGALSVGCGGDNLTPIDNGNGGAGGQAGSGGNGGNGGSTAGAGGDDASNTCGSEVCTLPSELAGMAEEYGLRACCVDAAESLCGTSVDALGEECAPPAAAITCGSQTCEPIAGLIEACCAAGDVCGTPPVDGSDGCNAPPTPDLRCGGTGTIEVPFLGTQSLCCIEETGECGVNAAQLGAGCLTAEDLGPLGGFLSDLPSCGEGTQTDAGVTDDSDAGV